MKRFFLAAILLAATATPATAYTSYLKPSAFWPQSEAITVEGAFASQFFTPQIAVGADLTLLNPEGARAQFNSVAVDAQATTLATDLRRGGTYRFSTGEQMGRVTTLVGVDGQWRPLGQGEVLPEGALTTTLQTVTLADVYVTRGAPTRTVVDRAIGRLAIRPVTHPNQVLAASGFQIEVLFDGAPMANTAVVLYAAGDADTKVDRFVVTGADGRAMVALDAPGQYVLAARHRANAPEGSEAAVRSYTTTLTFDAMTVLPAIVEIPVEDEDDGGRRRTTRRPLGR